MLSKLFYKTFHVMFYATNIDFFFNTIFRNLEKSAINLEFLTNNAMNDITHELRNFMRNKGYTQESLAKQLGVSQARI